MRSLCRHDGCGESDEMFNQPHKGAQLRDIGWTWKIRNSPKLVWICRYTTLILTHWTCGRVKLNFFLLNVIPTLLAADNTAQTPSTCSENKLSKRSGSSTTRTVLWAPWNARSARRLYSSLELHRPIDARRNLYLPHGVIKMVKYGEEVWRGI